MVIIKKGKKKHHLIFEFAFGYLEDDSRRGRVIRLHTYYLSRLTMKTNEKIFVYGMPSERPRALYKVLRSRSRIYASIGKNIAFVADGKDRDGIYGFISTWIVE